MKLKKEHKILRETVLILINALILRSEYSTFFLPARFNWKCRVCKERIGLYISLFSTLDTTTTKAIDFAIGRVCAYISCNLCVSCYEAYRILPDDNTQSALVRHFRSAYYTKIKLDYKKEENS